MDRTGSSAHVVLGPPHGGLRDRTGFLEDEWEVGAPSTSARVRAATWRARRGPTLDPVYVVARRDAAVASAARLGALARSRAEVVVWWGPTLAEWLLCAVVAARLRVVGVMDARASDRPLATWTPDQAARVSLTGLTPADRALLPAVRGAARDLPRLRALVAGSALATAGLEERRALGPGFTRVDRVLLEAVRAHPAPLRALGEGLAATQAGTLAAWWRLGVWTRSRPALLAGDGDALHLTDAGLAVLAGARPPPLAGEDAPRSAGWVLDPSGHTARADGFDPGAIACLRAVPPWSARLSPESRRVVEHCVGRPYPVVEVDHQGLVVLDVSSDVDGLFGGYGNDLRVEPELLVLVRPGPARRG